jgi:hypothetical protein
MFLNESPFWSPSEITLPKSRLATILGMRQIGQLDRFPQSKMRVVNAILSRMSFDELAKCIEIGKDFVCGYRPGIIACNDDFNAVAEKTNIGPVYREFARQVLVDGVKISSINTDFSGKQVVDQACITICRQIAGIDSYRSNTVKEVITKFDIFAEPDKIHKGSHVFASLSGLSLKMVQSYLVGSVVPEFSVAAYASLLMKMPNSEISVIYDLMNTVLDEVLLIDDNYWFDSKKGIDSKMIIIGIPACFRSSLYVSPDINSTSVFPDVFSIQLTLDSILSFKAASNDAMKKDDFYFTFKDVLVVDFLKVKALVDRGVSLFYLSNVYGEETGKNKLALYNRYTRKLNKPM